MQPFNVINIFKRMIFKGEFVQISRKLKNRLFNVTADQISDENLNYLKQNSISISKFLKELDAALYFETRELVASIKCDARQILKDIQYDLGGGGAYDLLYFLVRYVKPRNVVETGVASGFSSYACLKALEVNKTGDLLSSDFPYFRIPDPERYIGIIVPEKLKKNWKLFIEGDQKNLPKICEAISEINLFHYDSEKSYEGRDFAMSFVKDKLSQNAIVIMDDIQNNDFFFDYINKESIKNFQIFEFEGKYLGMWWGEESALNQKKI
ncbi:class I SAM-dependent methyltransferase [Kiloniella majae]|uniref:class I SAM-dependent methyltransferase n=1 Tax=Kiloniella majae TaxID=1938558 RepID=UPI000A27723A|nr:class I SAM-dependent methyltransferase [Kiloniella majae]